MSIATAALCVVACSDPATDAGRPTRDRVSVVALPYLTFLPLHIAVEDGHFAERGLDVELVRLGRSQEVMAALGSGDVDVAPGMITVNDLNLIARGARIRVVAGMGQLSADHCTFAAMVTRRDLWETGALRDPRRLRELRYDVDRLIPFGYWLDLYLRPFDVHLDDVDVVDLPGPAAVEALRDGSIDVTLDSQPFLTLHAASDDAVVFSPVGEIVPGYTLTVIKYGERLLDRRPDLGERFAAAMLSAFRQYRQGKTPRNVQIAARATGLSEAQLEAACWADVRSDGQVDPGPIRGFQEWLLDRGLIERVLDEEELYDHRFIRRAHAEADP